LLNSEIYPIFIVDGLSFFDEIYTFKTEKGIDFYVRFVNASHYFSEICASCQMVHEVSFESTVRNGGLDIKISNTIRKIIYLFIVKHESPVMFTCDSTDNLNHCRNKLFKNWYDQWEQKDLFQLEERTIVFDDYILNLGLIAYKWDPNIKEYLKQIDAGSLG